MVTRNEISISMYPTLWKLLYLPSPWAMFDAHVYSVFPHSWEIPHPNQSADLFSSVGSALQFRSVYTCSGMCTFLRE